MGQGKKVIQRTPIEMQEFSSFSISLHHALPLLKSTYTQYKNTKWHTRCSWPVQCFIQQHVCVGEARFTVCVISQLLHSVHCFTYTVTAFHLVFLWPMQLTDPLLPFHPDSPIPAFPFRSSFYTCSLNHLLTTHKIIYLYCTYVKLSNVQAERMTLKCKESYIFCD